MCLYDEIFQKHIIAGSTGSAGEDSPPPAPSIALSVLTLPRTNTVRAIRHVHTILTQTAKMIHILAAR